MSIKKSVIPNDELVQNGVKFQCQGSGKCCVSHGEYGYVYLSLADRARLARHFDLSIEKFSALYCRQEDGFWLLKEHNTKGDCSFLKDKKCTVYEARPTQCRTWPFWPDVLSTKKWRKEVVEFCPGIGKGKHYSWEEIKKIVEIEQNNVRSMTTPTDLLRDK